MKSFNDYLTEISHFDYNAFKYKGKVVGAIYPTGDGRFNSKRFKSPDTRRGVSFVQVHKTREDAEKHLIAKSGLDD